MREELRLASGDFCIGCVGNLTPVKDHMTLLRAVQEVDQTGKNWRLLLAGEGPERSKLEAFVNAHPEWKTRVSFLGSSNRVAELLNAMDVYVLPSVNEGISNSLLEAKAAGLPVVACDTGGNPEVIVQDESGLLFEVGNFGRLAGQLQLLWGRPELRARLGLQARRRVLSEFSIDSMVRKYEQLYESVACAKPASARAASGA